MARDLVTIAELARMLAARIDQLAPQLLPGGRRQGPEWVGGAIGGQHHDTISVKLTEPRRGVWAHFAANAGGDALDLVAYCLYGGDKRKAIGWARHWLGLSDASPAEVDRRRKAAARAAGKAAADQAAALRRAARYARGLWLSGQPSIAGTPAELYLRGRGVDLRRLPRLPGALRFHAAVYCQEADAKLPALLAAIQGMPAGAADFACHRTYLAPRGGLWDKAGLRQPKKVIGGYRGGFIALNRGASGKPMKAAVDGEEVLIAEGIEDGLSAAMVLPDLRCIAAISVSNIARLSLPAQIETVTLLTQNDPPGSPALDAIDKAVTHFQRELRRVKLARPPAHAKDINDLVREG